MQEPEQHVKYFIRRQPDGQFTIMMKDLTNGDLTIESSHDTIGEAKGALKNLNGRPSQAETMKFIHSMMDAIKNQ